MLDSKLLRSDLQTVVANLKKRGFDFDVQQYEQLEQRRVVLQQETQDLQAKRNSASKQIGLLKAQGGDVKEILADVADLGDQLKKREEELEELLKTIQDYLSQVPNLIDESVPAGHSEEDNQELRRWGDVPTFDFAPKDHIELGHALGQIDFDAAVKISGARFVVLHRGVARLQRALAQFMLDLHVTEHGYREVYVPFLVKSEALYGTGQLPKFAEEQFQVAGDWDLFLIPTAEVPVTNLVRDEVVEAQALPLKFVAHTPSFRSEAGSYGKDTRGMIRQHQFEKVEMVQMVRPDTSMQALEEMLGHAETVLQRLNLPYRVVTLCAGDIGFSAAKTYDLEVWLPGQHRYREISSVSNTRDFQARRMQARWRNPESKKPELLHTLNGSGLAVGRTLIAVMENYQRADGSIEVPAVLRPYMGNLTVIS